MLVKHQYFLQNEEEYLIKNILTTQVMEMCFDNDRMSIEIFIPMFLRLHSKLFHQCA